MARLRVGNNCDRTECFGNKCANCQILEEPTDTEPCPFFKTRDQEADEVNRNYSKLLEEGRVDLVQKYMLMAFVRKVNRAAGRI